MLSDESSSESETGRFKSHTKTDNALSVNDNKKRPTSRYNESSARNFDGRHDRNRKPDVDKRERVRHDRSPIRFRKSPERRHDSWRSKDRVSDSTNARKRERSYSRERSYRKDLKSKSKEQSPRRNDRELNKDSRRDKRPLPQERKTEVKKSHSDRDIKKVITEESRRSITSHIAKNTHTKQSNDTKKLPTNNNEKKMQNLSKSKSSAEKTSPKQVTHSRTLNPKSKTEYHSPISETMSDIPARSQPTSYYNTPEKNKTESQETVSLSDSSEDEETLRARLLQLETELKKTKLKKNKKKHRHKHKHNDKTKDDDDDNSVVEVSSTTDIKEPKNNKGVNIEEGEIEDDKHEDLRVVLKPRCSGTQKIAGPALPPHLAQKYERIVTEVDVEGPALPPHMHRTQEIGPTIPSDLRMVLANKADTSQISSEEEDYGIGPLPQGSEEKWTSAHRHLEERALEMKIKKIEGHGINEKEIKKREEWMLELPEAKAKIIGLGPRQFRAREAPDMSDRSCWTETPESKNLKAAGYVPDAEDITVTLKQEARSKHIEDRDREQESAVKKHKKKHKREESLLEMHEKKLKKKKKKEEKDGPKERRPFDRNVDLQANRFDEAQKKAIIKKAQHLDSRFSRGEAKYL